METTLPGRTFPARPARPDEDRDTLPYEDDERPTIPSEVTLALHAGLPLPLRVDTFADAFFAGGPAAVVREALAAARAVAVEEDRAHERELASRRSAIARAVLAVVCGCLGLLAAAFGGA